MKRKCLIIKTVVSSSHERRVVTLGSQVPSAYSAMWYVKLKRSYEIKIMNHSFDSEASRGAVAQSVT